jgi:hypothetical protein
MRVINSRISSSVEPRELNDEEAFGSPIPRTGAVAICRIMSVPATMRAVELYYGESAAMAERLRPVGVTWGRYLSCSIAARHRGGLRLTPYDRHQPCGHPGAAAPR